MADILFTHSYFLKFDPKQARAHTPYPPLGTLYAASVVRNAGFRVRLFDSMLADSEQEISPILQQRKPRLVVIYDDDFNYLTKMCLTRMREAAFRLSTIAKEHGVCVVVHGADSADHAEEYLRHGADAVIVGEGEMTLLEISKKVLGDSEPDFAEIPGVVFLKDGVLVRTQRRAPRKDLDALPFPAWDLINLDQYRSIWNRYHGFFSLNMVTTRGCPFHCNWCAKPVYGQVYNSRSPKNVVNELKCLASFARPDHLWFSDDIFGLKPGWIQEFRDCIRREGLHIPFKIQARADLLLDRDTIPALAEAGCEEVWIGAESGSQKILDAMEKGITIAQIREARLRLEQSGIRACFFLQFGYRTETKEDIRATIKMVRDLRPDDIGISISYPLPGTKFYETVKSEMNEKRNWEDSDDLAMMYTGTYSQRYYRLLHRYVHRLFRVRQGLEALRKSPAGRFRTVRERLRSVAGIGYHAPVALWKRIQLGQLGGV